MRDLFFNKISFCSCFAVFLLFFFVELNTPFQSDDYSYFLIGNELSEHIHHYTSWSGRVVADYCATIILKFNHLFVSVVIAFLAFVTCFVITDLPNKLLDRKFNYLHFLLLASLYWIAHPEIGEAVFWVVGACNYMITTCFVLIFLYVYVIKKNSSNILIFLMLPILSIFAGCSNENTSIATIFLFLLLTLYFKRQNVRTNNKLFYFVLLGLVIGTAILILSPGNFSRLANPHYADWREMPLFDKIMVHLVRFRKTFNYANIILIFCYILVFINRKKINDYRPVFFSLIFYITSLLAYFILFASPSMPRRAFSSIFVFQLISLSCVLPILPINKFLNKIYFLVSCCIFVTFVLSFSFLLNSYSVTKTQEYLRNSHICYEKLTRGNDIKVEIPSYYFVKLLRHRDDFDLFHSGEQARFFKVKEITVNNVNCDYSIITDSNNKVLVVNKSSLSNVSGFFKQKSFFRKDSQLILESDTPISSDISLSFVGAEDLVPKNIVFSSFFRLKDKYYAAVTGDFVDISSVIIK